MSDFLLDLPTGLFNPAFGFESWIVGNSTRELFEISLHLMGFALQFILGALFQLFLLSA